jgi:hypothetical protein
MELELLVYLLDIIDWNHVPSRLTKFLQNNPAKDKIKIYILSELIRDFSVRPSFVDYFADAIDRSAKKRVVLKNFDDIIKGLEDLNINHRITLGLALAYSTDEAIRQKGRLES